MSTDNQTLPKKRRRLNRKRRSKANNVSKGARSVPILEDTPFRLERALITKKKSRVERSLPILLMERQTGLWMKSFNGATRWQERMIQQQRKGGESTPHRSDCTAPVWRPYAKLEFTFRQLQTPVSDVVVGLDATGDLIVALGGRLSAGQHEQPPFVLRFYSLPSKPRPLDVSHCTRPLERSTPVMTVPIDFTPTQSRGSFLPAVVPTNIVFTLDGDLGLAYTGIRSLNEKSALTLFQRPRVQSESAHSSVFSIRIPGLKACWFERTSFLPSVEGTRTWPSAHSCLWSEEYNIPGHVVFLHCKDSFRFVWVRSLGWVQGAPQPCPDRSTWAHDSWKTMTRSDNPFISTPMQDEPQWETQVFDCANGLVCTENSCSQSDDVGLQIPLEVSLSFRSLAESLFQHFQQLFDFSNKDRFDIGFVDQRNGFRAVELLVSWPKISGEGGLAAFVLIEMRSGDFKVLRWIRERPEVFDNESYVTKFLLRLRRNKSSMCGALDNHDDSIWDFLESPPKDGSGIEKPYMYWMPKTDHHLNHPYYLRTGSIRGCFSLNNSAVLDEAPIEYMDHVWAPVSLRYE